MAPSARRRPRPWRAGFGRGCMPTSAFRSPEWRGRARGGPKRRGGPLFAARDAEGSKPVGLTFIGIAAAVATTQRFQWTGDRWDNRRRSLIAALELLVRAPEL